MISTTIFTISGLGIIVLTTTKILEQKRKKQLFISNAISRGDTHARKLYHTAVHLYSEGKEKTLLFFQKKIRMHLRNSLNKLISFLKEKKGQYINNMRNSKLLKKPDGISEFFKNMSNVEKGNGEIHDVCENTRQDDSVGLGSQNKEKELE